MGTVSDAIATVSSHSNGLTTGSCQYLTFQLGDELYGVDILRVQEIKGYTPVTPIPNTPFDIKGVLNLRGTIVPIIELHAKFGMPTAGYTMFTVIVVMVVRDRIMGIIVDAVSEVLSIAQQDIHPAPAFGCSVDLRFIHGIAQVGDRLVTLLDIDELLSDSEAAELAACDRGGHAASDVNETGRPS